MKEYKVLKANPGQPSWTVGSVIQLDENEAEAHVRGGLIEAHVPKAAAPQSPTPEKKPPVESATEEEHQAPRNRRA